MCEHDYFEREMAISDGLCPLCGYEELIFLRNEVTMLKKYNEQLRQFCNFDSSSE